MTLGKKDIEPWKEWGWGLRAVGGGGVTRYTLHQEPGTQMRGSGLSSSLDHTTEEKAGVIRGAETVTITERRRRPGGNPRKEFHVRAGIWVGGRQDTVFL